MNIHYFKKANFDYKNTKWQEGGAESTVFFYAIEVELLST